ncbi:MAG TPA: hypothetical protein DDZ91_14485 [Firmicutes bacterium]|jgi:DNA repair protein RadC|nr:hypothetical protein [Bacillota bacterium]
MQENLFYGGSVPKKDNKNFYWITSRLVRESGPWYAETMKSPEDVSNMVIDHMDLDNCDKEHFIVAYLNRKGALNAVCTVSIGGLHSSIVHPREVFKPAILTSSASVISIHNHPSGDPTPSREDIDITQRLIEAGKILGIDVLDHVIIGTGKHVSFKAKGFI